MSTREPQPQTQRPFEDAERQKSAFPVAVLWAAAIGFLGLWLGAAAFWSMMTLMIGAMANDSGSVNPQYHAGLLIVVLIADVVIGLAGLPGAMAFRWRGRRKLLAILCAALAAGGLTLQIGAAILFLNATR